MKLSQLNQIVAVDSETGIFWKGEQVFRHTTLIRALIEQETQKTNNEVRTARLNREEEQPVNFG